MPIDHNERRKLVTDPRFPIPSESKSKAKIAKYGVFWNRTAHPLVIEMDCIRMGGEWKKSDGTKAGMGLQYHYLECIKHLWPWVKWHPWADLQLECYLGYRIIGQLGPASTGKSFIPSACVLIDYYVHPTETTVLVSSTTLESLEMRVWGEIKKLHRFAKSKFTWLPGHLIEGKRRIVTDHRSESVDGRDFRNGLAGVATKRGQQFQGMEEYVGIKNKRVRMLADECFVAGTLVDTIVGPVPIQNIQPGDTVMSAIGPRQVIACSSRVAHCVVTVVTCSGSKVTCTPNHPFFTQYGWIKACNLSQKHYILSHYEAMSIMQMAVQGQRERAEVPTVPDNQDKVRVLRDAVSPIESNAAILQSLLLVEMEANQAGVQGEIIQRQGGGSAGGEAQKVVGYGGCGEGIIFTTDEAIQSDAHSREPGAPIAHPESYGTQTQNPWREWDGTDKSRVQFDADGSGRGVELSSQDRNEAWKWIPNQLQSRCLIATFEIGHRGRWEQSQQSQKTGEGFEEGHAIKGAWVDRVEVQKQDHSGFPNSSNGAGGNRVYNLQVEGHPSYSVSGLLVHNCQFLPRVFVDSIANLNKNPDFKCVASGNPKDTLDALGVICEPAANRGGWDGGIDQEPGTKTWETRFPKGICVQLYGLDSPNLDGKMGIPLITQEQIDADIAFYGRDSIQFSMMNLGCMPRGQGARRVLTRQMCLKFQAMEEPVWRGGTRTKVGFLDAAYRGVGGDRCVFGEMEFGAEATPIDGAVMVGNLINQTVQTDKLRQVLALTYTTVVPIDPKLDEIPEDQIASFVKEQCEQRGIEPSHFFFDAGMKASLATAFARLWSPYVNAVDFGGTPTERNITDDINVRCKDRYFNFVTELWYSVRQVVEARQFRGMTEDVMLEFSQREWMIREGGNKIQVEPKDKMKLKIGRSPDLADACAIGVEGARRLGFRIESIATKEVKRNTNTWKREVKQLAQNHHRSRELNYS